jgi:hypothetical protein
LSAATRDGLLVVRSLELAVSGVWATEIALKSTTTNKFAISFPGTVVLPLAKSSRLKTLQLEGIARV